MLRQCGNYMDDAGRWGRDRPGQLCGTDSSTNGSFRRWVIHVMPTDTHRHTNLKYIQPLSSYFFSPVFPGQHDCVTVINNFFSRTRLEYYTRPQGLETEPILPPKLAGPLHKIIMTTNLNPVKVNIVLRSIYFPTEIIFYKLQTSSRTSHMATDYHKMWSCSQRAKIH